MIKSVTFNNNTNLDGKYEFNNTLNVIIGKNNSGKTNLLDGIKLAFSAITNDYFKISDSDFKDVGEIIYLNNFIQNSNLIKMALINYIRTFYFDNIFTLSEKAMLKLGIFEYNHNDVNNNNPRDISDVLGMYCHYNEELFNILEHEISKKELDEMKKCKRFILICPELINKFCKDFFDRFKDSEIMDIAQLFEMILDEVLFHEIGHGVFDYINDEYNESRADYFASLTSDGTLDKTIEIHYDIVKWIYRLFFIESDIEEIKKYVYNL